MPMIAITTSSSTNVKPRFFCASIAAMTRAPLWNPSYRKRSACTRILSLGYKSCKRFQCYFYKGFVVLLLKAGRHVFWSPSERTTHEKAEEAQRRHVAGWFGHIGRTQPGGADTLPPDQII